jgi:hypothetical protein
VPQPSTGPIDADTFLTVCSHTHLFPGVRCRVQGLPDPAAFAADPRPIHVDLRYSDGVIIDAELGVGAPDGPALIVPAHTTGAGTLIDSRTWSVREFTPAGEEVELRIGSHTSS